MKEVCKACSTVTNTKLCLCKHLLSPGLECLLTSVVSVCPPRPEAERAIFSKSPIYKAHSLNNSFTSSSEIAGYKQQMPTQNSSKKGRQLKDVGKAQEVGSNQSSWSASLSLCLKPNWPLPRFSLLAAFPHLLLSEGKLSLPIKAHGWHPGPGLLLRDVCIQEHTPL